MAVLQELALLIPDVGSSRVQDMPAYNGSRESTRIMMTAKSKLDQLGPPSYASGECKGSIFWVGAPMFSVVRSVAIGS